WSPPMPPSVGSRPTAPRWVRWPPRAPTMRSNTSASSSRHRVGSRHWKRAERSSLGFRLDRCGPDLLQELGCAADEHGFFLLSGQPQRRVGKITRFVAPIEREIAVRELEAGANRAGIELDRAHQECFGLDAVAAQKAR